MDDLIKRDDALLPCPFCGGEASIHKGMVAFEDYEIHCDICGVCSPNFGALNETLTPQSDAIAAWNTRALPAIDPAAIREAALRETAALCDRYPFVEGVKTAILALIGEANCVIREKK